MTIIDDLAGDLAVIFPDLATGTIEVLASGVSAFTCPAIVKTDPGYQDIDGVGLVSAEPHVVVLATDAARISALADPSLRFDGLDWQIYGEPLPRRTGLTTFNLIRN